MALRKALAGKPELELRRRLERLLARLEVKGPPAELVRLRCSSSELAAST